MNHALARILTCLYPRQWRERYGVEFETLLQNGPGGFRTSANVVWSALCEYVLPTVGGKMDQHPSFVGVVKNPSAFVPIAMSLTALAMVLSHIAIYGAVREPDEGTAAHIWQLLMGLQLPILAFFAIKWLPKAPRQTLIILGMQAGAALASMAPVFYFNL
jgi:hypothetical protein